MITGHVDIAIGSQENVRCSQSRKFFNPYRIAVFTKVKFCILVWHTLFNFKGSQNIKEQSVIVITVFVNLVNFNLLEDIQTTRTCCPDVIEFVNVKPIWIAFQSVVKKASNKHET